MLRLSTRSLYERVLVPLARFTSTGAGAVSASVAAEWGQPEQQGDGDNNDRARRRSARKQQPVVVYGIEGTAEFYTRQLVVVDADSSAPHNWPKKLELSDHVIAAYAKAIAAVESPKASPLKAIAATPFPTVCTSASHHPSICENEEDQQRKHDLMIFPDQIRVKNVELSHIPSLVAQLLQPNPNVHDIVASSGLAFQSLDDGYHILVCAHANRDDRCGCKGPELLQWLQRVGVKKHVPLHLYSSSHFGGHRYAANCIVYPSGDWYGLLNEPHDADALVDALVDGEPLRLAKQWRGRIATSKPQQITLLQSAIATSETTK